MANSLDHRRYKGVYKSGHKFKAQLQHCGNQYYLGSYSSALQAAHAYDEKWREIYATDPSIVKTLPNFDKDGNEHMSSLLADINRPYIARNNQHYSSNAVYSTMGNYIPEHNGQTSRSRYAHDDREMTLPSLSQFLGTSAPSNSDAPSSSGSGSGSSSSGGHSLVDTVTDSVGVGAGAFAAEISSDLDSNLVFNTCPGGVGAQNAGAGAESRPDIWKRLMYINSQLSLGQIVCDRISQDMCEAQGQELERGFTTGSYGPPPEIFHTLVDQMRLLREEKERLEMHFAVSFTQPNAPAANNSSGNVIRNEPGSDSSSNCGDLTNSAKISTGTSLNTASAITSPDVANVESGGGVQLPYPTPSAVPLGSASASASSPEIKSKDRETDETETPYFAADLLLNPANHNFPRPPPPPRPSIGQPISVDTERGFETQTGLGHSPMLQSQIAAVSSPCPVVVSTFDIITEDALVGAEPVVKLASQLASRDTLAHAPTSYAPPTLIRPPVLTTSMVPAADPALIPTHAVPTDLSMALGGMNTEATAVSMIDRIALVLEASPNVSTMADVEAVQVLNPATVHVPQFIPSAPTSMMQCLLPGITVEPSCSSSWNALGAVELPDPVPVIPPPQGAKAKIPEGLLLLRSSASTMEAEKAEKVSGVAALAVEKPVGYPLTGSTAVVTKVPFYGNENKLEAGSNHFNAPNDMEALCDAAAGFTHDLHVPLGMGCLSPIAADSMPSHNHEQQDILFNSSIYGSNIEAGKRNSDMLHDSSDDSDDDGIAGAQAQPSQEQKIKGPKAKKRKVYIGMKRG